jgi:hypothetical protein
MRHIPVHVYSLQSFLAGILCTDRPRLTDALNSPAGHIELLDVVSARYADGTTRHYGEQAFVLKKSVYFVCDRPSNGYRPEHSPISVGHVRHHIALSCGPFFIEGRAHLPPDGDLERKLFDSPHQFIPLTGATISSNSMPVISEQAVLVNRDRIDYVIANVISIGDGIVEHEERDTIRTQR